MEKLSPKKEVKTELRPEEEFREAVWRSCLKATVAGTGREQCPGRKRFVNVYILQE